MAAYLGMWTALPLDLLLIEPASNRTEGRALPRPFLIFLEIVGRNLPLPCAPLLVPAQRKAAMRWKIPLLLLGLLLVGYTAWPFYGLYKLASAVETRDVAVLRELIDARALRLSLARQISGAYLEAKGNASQRGGLGSGMGSAVAETLLAELITPEALADLLSKGSAGPFTPAGAAAPLTRSALGSAWKVWLHSDYGIGTFSVTLPPDVPAPQRFELQLRLLQWKWKLFGIQIPEELRRHVANEWIKRERRQ